MNKSKVYAIAIPILGCTLLVAPSAFAATVIPTASSTELITNIASSGWDAFYQAIPYIFGAVVLIAIVWMGIRWILKALSGRH